MHVVGSCALQACTLPFPASKLSHLTPEIPNLLTPRRLLTQTLAQCRTWALSNPELHPRPSAWARKSLSAIVSCVWSYPHHKTGPSSNIRLLHSLILTHWAGRTAAQLCLLACRAGGCVLPDSQVGPWKPAGHWQLKLLTPRVQAPPF